MMGRLLLMRHGKSDWNADFETDHDRPINERGERAAQAIGLLLKGREAHEPELILCSTARRTRETLECVRAASAWNGVETEYLDALYLAAPTRAVRLLAEHTRRASVLMIVGHQPTLAGMLALLTGGNQVTYPTAALAIVDFDEHDWMEGRLRGQGTLNALIPPRILASG